MPFVMALYQEMQQAYSQQTMQQQCKSTFEEGVAPDYEDSGGEGGPSADSAV